MWLVSFSYFAGCFLNVLWLWLIVAIGLEGFQIGQIAIRISDFLSVVLIVCIDAVLLALATILHDGDLLRRVRIG